MAKMMTDEGAKYVLEQAFTEAAADTHMVVRLMTSMVTLSDGDTPSTHVIAAGGGYSGDQSLVAAYATVTVNDGIPQVTWPMVTWVFTGPLTSNASVVGYQVLNAAKTLLLFEETFATPKQPTLNGDTINLIVTLALGNGTPG